MRLPKEVRMVEVGPRDGLQNEARTVPTATKIALIDRLAEAGLGMIEAGSFVSPRWVPQMADTAAVMAGIARRPGVRYPVLVPNLQGYQAARAAGADAVAIFAAASESFSRRNINCSIAESLARFAPVAEAARRDGVALRGYVSCVIDCPYEGAVAPEAAADVAARLLALGCYEVSLGDTIGTGTAARVEAMLAAAAARVPIERLAVHFHDTYGQAVANILVALEHGVAVVDSAVAGLGGCPFAPGAAGNVASEDVLYLLDGLGIRTGVDLVRLAAAGRFIAAALGRPPASKAACALAARTA
ncbi:MAG TPA: hydroxymethylglutaryl-CoA lyase [Stellaceae bacterium]|nr:hydroxymethylglutaryl-CoA lyase [Stellaceae bacterium]